MEWLLDLDSLVVEVDSYFIALLCFTQCLVELWN